MDSQYACIRSLIFDATIYVENLLTSALEVVNYYENFTYLDNRQPQKTMNKTLGDDTQ